MKIGISSLAHIVSSSNQLNESKLHEILMHGTRTCMEFSEKNDLDVCEILIDPMTTFSSENKDSFIKLCNEYHIQKQVHAALLDVSLCSNNSEISKSTLKTFKNNLDIAKEIKASTITIHPGISSIPISAIKKHNYLTLIRQLKILLDYSKEMDVKICVENMDPGAGICRSFEEMSKLYQDVSNSLLYFTYDTSHLWMNSTNFSKFIQELHPHIKNVHIADNIDKKFDQHPTIGSGNIPFPAILQELKAHDYDNSLIIEILDIRGLNKSIEYVREYLL
jgi:sugar phosphate isomerase/epimerase